MEDPRVFPPHPRIPAPAFFICKIMAVNRPNQSVLRTAALPALLAAITLAAPAALHAQAQNPSSVVNPFWGSVTAHPATDDVLKLSLEDAVRRGFDNNLGLREAEAGEKIYHAEKDQALQQFLPTITLVGDTGVYQHNLAALGFSRDLVTKIFPGGKVPAGLSFITRDTLTEGQLRFSQTLFSGPVIAGWRAAGAAQRSAYFAKMTARGEVVQQVATAYLHAIAAASEVDNAGALERQDKVQLDNVHAAHLAGTAANLDELRARVQLQTQQQALINAETTYFKDLILLKREIGIDPGQQIALTDPAPYYDLATDTPEEVLAVAYKSRQDYQNLQNQVIGFKAVHAAYRSQRLPTLSFNGYYGVSEVTGVGSHGNFVAQGTLKLPLFREASLRGDTDAAQAQLSSAQAQLADLKPTSISKSAPLSSMSTHPASSSRSPAPTSI